MLRLSHVASILAAAGMIVCGSAAAQVQRTAVASFGNDSNVASNCILASPCRTLQVAHGVTNSGGEIYLYKGDGLIAVWDWGEAVGCGTPEQGVRSLAHLGSLLGA